MDWARENASEIWLTSISVILGIVASWFFFRLQKQPRVLDYATELLPVGVTGNMQAPSSLKIVWEGSLPWQHPDPTGGRDWPAAHILSSPSIFRIHIMNTGKKAIEASDFKDPIRVRVKQGSIIDLEIVEVSHPQMHPLGPIRDATEAERNFIPVLMNPGDRITLQGIADGAGWSAPTVEAWFKDQSRPMRHRTQITEEPLRELLWDRLRAGFGSNGWQVLAAIVAVLSVLVAILSLTRDVFDVSVVPGKPTPSVTRSTR